MSSLRKVGTSILIVLVIFALCVDAFYIYYHFNKSTVTTGINNIGSQVSKTEVIDTSNATNEELQLMADRVLFDVNFYDNTNKNGVVLAELRMNYFMSYRLEQQDYRSSGMQRVINAPNLVNTYKNNYNIELGYNNDKQLIYGEYHYDTTDGVSWNGELVNGTDVSVATGLKRDTGYIVRIDNEPYLITLDGQFIEQKGWFDGGIFPHTVTWKYNFEDIFLCCLLATQTKSVDLDETFIQLDLSPYFSIKKYDVESGKFKSGDYVDVLKSYAVCRCHYSKNGAISSSQSLFGVIANNKNYNITDNSICTDYWNASLLYTLDVNVFDYRFSEVYNGYFVSLNQNIINKLNILPSAKIDVLVNLAVANKNIVGFDYNAFQNLKINTLTLKSNDTVTLYVLDNAFKNTQLNTLYRTSIITLNASDTAFNNQYTEVLL